MFSRTVIVLKSSRFWNVRAMPRRITPCGGVDSSDSPSKFNSPVSGRYSRVITLNAVVLPAPFGPISPTISPSPTSNETSSSATIPPKRRVTCFTSSSAIGVPYDLHGDGIPGGSGRRRGRNGCERRLAPAAARGRRRRAARARLARRRVDVALGRGDPRTVLRRAEHPDRPPLAGGGRADGRDRLPAVRLSVSPRPARGRHVVPRGARAPAGARRTVARAFDRGRARDRPPGRSGGAARRDLLRARRLRVARVGCAVVRARARRAAG